MQPNFSRDAGVSRHSARGLSGYSGDCWSRILAVLHRPENKAKALWIGGHSLGVALAMVAAARLNPACIYTFGSPRVGNTAFCASFAGRY